MKFFALSLLVLLSVVSASMAQQRSDSLIVDVLEVRAVKTVSPETKQFRIIATQTDGSLAFLDGRQVSAKDNKCIELVSRNRIAEKKPANLKLEFLGDINSSSLNQVSGQHTYQYRISKILKCSEY